MAPCILTLGTRWRCVVSFTTWPLYPRRKSSRYPLNRRVGGPQSRSGRSGEEKKYLSLPGIESRSSSPAAVTYTQPKNVKHSCYLLRHHLALWFPRSRAARSLDEDQGQRSYHQFDVPFLRLCNQFEAQGCCFQNYRSLER
jgi:hypothetical protein